MSRAMKALPFVVLGALMVAMPQAWATWTADGVPICTASGDQHNPQLITVDDGGAIVTWYDRRSDFAWDIYALRVNAEGVRLWDVDGLEMCTAGGSQTFPQLTTDGARGAIVAWEDDRSGSSANHDIYAQRANAGGWLEWAEQGVAICTATGNQQFPYVISDGAGGAIIAWEDQSSDTYRYIVAQRLSPSGALLWPAAGVRLTTTDSYKLSMDLDADGVGGAVATWVDRCNGNYDIYAQRIDASGARQWTNAGVPVCTAGATQSSPRVASDGLGGALITWSDERGGVGADDIYAQKLNAAGVVEWLWAPNGRIISSPPGRQYGAMIVSDRVGGAVIAWNTDDAAGRDIYVQWVDDNGTNRWEVDGMPLCTAAGTQVNAAITFGSQGYAIVAWHDYRSGSGDSDIYAEETELTCSSVETPNAPAAVHLDPNYPNPFNPRTTVSFTLPATGQVRVAIYDAKGQMVARLVDETLAAGAHSIDWDGRDAYGASMPSGTYFCRLTSPWGVETRNMGLIK
jgi:hypothetical protein